MPSPKKKTTQHKKFVILK